MSKAPNNVLLDRRGDGAVSAPKKKKKPNQSARPSSTAKAQYDMAPSIEIHPGIVIDDGDVCACVRVCVCVFSIPLCSAYVFSEESTTACTLCTSPDGSCENTQFGHVVALRTFRCELAGGTKNLRQKATAFLIKFSDSQDVSLSSILFKGTGNYPQISSFHGIIFEYHDHRHLCSLCRLYH